VGNVHESDSVTYARYDAAAMIAFSVISSGVEKSLAVVRKYLEMSPLSVDMTVVGQALRLPTK
jgi:hypothetical protein